MTLNNKHSRGIAHYALPLLSLAFIVSGCATTTPKQSSAHVEILEEIGFTITEDVRTGNNVRLDYDAAVHHITDGKHDQGIALLQSVADSAPESSAPQIDLGIAHHLAGDLEAAERHLLLALEINPDHPIAHNELGIVYRKSGRFTESRLSYEAALAIYPGYHFARRNLAILCDLYLVDLTCALENYEAYMATVPSDKEAEIWIADIRNRISQ